jgi:DNA-directed RNA polymerase subunit RPC12/RpoP
MIVFSCANCGRKYEKDLSLAGKKARCKECGHVFVIPKPSRLPVAASPVPVSSSQERRLGPDPAYPPVLDPYGLDDGPVASAAPASAEVDEEFVVPQRPWAGRSKSRLKPKREPASGPNPGIAIFDGLPWLVYLIPLAIAVVGLLLVPLSRVWGGYTLYAAAILLVLIVLYGFIGMVIVPFRESIGRGMLGVWLPIAWFNVAMGHFDRASLLALLPAAAYSLAYLITRWDAMKGAFLSWLYANIVLIVAALLVPPPEGTVRPAGTPRHRDTPPGFAGGMPPHAVHPPVMRRNFEPPPMLPLGLDPPLETSHLTVIVTGLDDQASGQAFGDRLGKLVGRVSGGFQISSSGSGGKSTYSISMVNPVEVNTFADQITWAKVTKISGQTITIDASGSPAE